MGKTDGQDALKKLLRKADSGRGDSGENGSDTDRYHFPCPFFFPIILDGYILIYYMISDIRFFF